MSQIGSATQFPWFDIEVIGGNAPVTATGATQWSSSNSVPNNIYYASGNVGIGTNTPTFTLDISGNVRSTGQMNAPSFFSTSDYRIKSNIKLINQTVDELKPIEYDLLGGSHDMGFLAHEVQEIFPFLVSGIKDDTQYQSINYNGFIALLVKEIQKLKQRVDILEQNQK